MNMDKLMTPAQRVLMLSELSDKAYSNVYTTAYSIGCGYETGHNWWSAETYNNAMKLLKDLSVVTRE